MGFLNLFRGAPEPAAPVIDAAVISEALERASLEIVADIWSTHIDDTRTRGKTPSLQDLEAAYTKSDLFYSVAQEIIQAMTGVEIHASIAVKTLLEHPNKIQDWSAFITQFMSAYLSTGQGSVLKLPLGSAAIQELHVLKTSSLLVEPGTFMDPYRRLSYSDGHNHYDHLTIENLITKINPSPISPIKPVSPLLSCWQIVQMDINLSTFQRRALERLPYMIGVVTNDMSTTKPQREMLSQSLKQIVGQTVVLPKGAHMELPGMVRNSITLPGLGEAAESRVCAALNVPAILVGFMVGLKRATYSNYGEARVSFYQETINPLLEQLGEAFSRGLGEEVSFTVEPPDDAPDSPEVQAEEDKASSDIAGGDIDAVAQDS